jgi:hypothetical protein
VDAGAKGVLAASMILLVGCASVPDPATDPQSRFMARLNQLCGQAFAGQIVASEPAGADTDMAGQPLIMHVRDCSPQRVAIPFHVGEDRSRTWIISQHLAGLRLKHDHRHADGTPDAVTMYGGDTVDQGSAARQSFPVDAESIAMFRANNLARSVTNVWTVEAGERIFAYELARPAGPNARRFRVEFDLTRPVPVPVPVPHAP